MAPRREVKNAEGEVIEEFGSKTTNKFQPKDNTRPGFSGVKNDRYATVVKKDGTIEIYRQDSLILPGTGFQTLVGSYSPDGVWTHNPAALKVNDIGIADRREEQYFSSSLTRNEVRNQAKIVVDKVLLTLKNPDGSNLYGKEARGPLVDHLVDGTTLSAETLSQLQTADSRNDLIDSVNITSLPTINIEGEGRKEYGNYYYPLALADGSTRQDRIKFTMKEPKGTKVDPFFFKNNKQFERTYGDIKGSVTLPIQPVISDRNTVDFAGLQLNAVDAALAGSAYSLADSENVEELFNKAGATIRGVQETLLKADTGAQEGLKVFLAQQAAGVQGLLSRTTGAVLNPNLELLFRGPQLRPFSFTFTLSPRNKKESIQTRNIIRFFKQGMSVKTTASNVFLKSPHVFDINYKTFDRNGTEKTHPSINLIKTCALIDCGVEYTPDGSYMTFNDEERTMTSYRISLQFTELDPVYDKDYNDPVPAENFIGY